MRKLRSSKDIAKELRKLRAELDIPLCVVIEELKHLKVKCSLANLGKIEAGEISCRADILGGLCLIYNVSTEIVLYRYYRGHNQ